MSYVLIAGERISNHRLSGAARDANGGLLQATENVGGKLDGFCFFFGVASWSAIVIGAWIVARRQPKAPVEIEVALNVNTKAVRAWIHASIFDPVTVLNDEFVSIIPSELEKICLRLEFSRIRSRRDWRLG